jgi:hypothetical protein
MRSEATPRIARDQRVQLNVRRAQQRDIADVVAGSRNIRTVEIHAEILSL